MEQTTALQKFCPNCGAENAMQAKFCPQCCESLVRNAGAPVPPPPPPVQTAPPVIIYNTNPVNAPVPYYYGKLCNKWAAFFLCLFFGILGVHKFYEGKIGMGIAYILTGGLFVVGWFVDVIALLCRPLWYYSRT